MYIEKRVPNLHSAEGRKTVKRKFLTYFNHVGSTKEQQIKTWKEMIWKPDFVFRFSQLAYELGYSNEQQISHFVLCIPRGGLYLYLEGDQTIPDAVENLRKGIALDLDTLNSIIRTAQDDSKPTVPFQAMKENRTQYTTEDTLRTVKESRYIQSIESKQDAMYKNNLVKLLDKIGDKLANVVDVVEDYQKKQYSRDRDRDRSNSRGRDHSRDNYKNRDRDRKNSRDYNKNRSREDHRERDRHRSNSRDGRRTQQRSRTGQRYFDKNEFCNYCDKTGHTTHRCHKLENYLKRKGKKITLHDEEEVQELAQVVQDLKTKLNSLKTSNSTNY